MNRFSDGFSDNSYEDLLNEYAGESLGSKTAKPVEEPVKKEVAPPVKKVTPKPVVKPEPVAAPLEEPVFNIDISHKKKPQTSFELDLIKPFDEVSSTNKVKEEPSQSNTMEFSARKTPLYKRYPTAKANEVKEDTNVQNTNRKKASPVAIFVANTIRKIEAKKNSSDNSQASEDYASAPTKNKLGILYKVNGKTKIDWNILSALIINSFKKNKSQFIVFGCCFLVAILLSAVALSCINDVLAINRKGEETVEVVLPNDADTKTAVKVLDEAGLINNSIFCNLFLSLMGEKDTGYLPGVYYFTDDLGVEKMIDRFKTSSTRGAMISVTIPEGYTIDQIFQRLEKNDICTAESLYKTIDTIDFSEEYSFIAKIDNKEERYHALEGYMFPATYEFEQGADPATVIRKFLNAFKSRWTEEYAAKAAELGMTTDDIIRLASIIEKEGANHKQFGLISSVLHNRLNRSGLYPTLDCDSTKDYVINTVSKRVTSTAKINAYILAYNTYECVGLPAGAICNPGADAIESALNPDSTQYYFFRHDKNGKIYMAETISQHDANGRTVNQVNSED